MASDNQPEPDTILPAREFPTSGFEVIDPTDLVEEEKLPFYKHDEYYPMRIGEVLKDRYQVVCKVGYGSSSTVWLCRDLRPKERSYWVLKVHVHTLKHNHELEVYRHLASVTIEHPARNYVRWLEDSFKVKSRYGEHDVFVMTPLGMSLRTFQKLQRDKVFQNDLAYYAIRQVLCGLDFLHEANVIHTDLHSSNLLIALTDDSILSGVEDDEMQKPSARKILNDTVIYVSRYMLSGAGRLTICDLGVARIGEEHSGSAMPVPYRAPEIILNMKWGRAVDIWSVALLAWDLLERRGIFGIYDEESEEANNAHHLARMTALLGPPPLEFLTRSEETSKYWNKDGKWVGPVPLPSETTFQSFSALAGDKKDLFLDFVKSLLCWLPEERPTTGQVINHPWLEMSKS